MLRNTETHYGSVSKFFHWLVFFLILALVLVGFFWEDAGANKGNAINMHKVVGVLTLFVIVLRILWSFLNKRPKLINAKRWEKIIEHSLQGLIYLCLLGMPLSGWTMATAAGRPPHLFSQPLSMPFIPLSKTLSTFAYDVHVVLAWTLISLVAIHILAAFKHQLINKDDVLKRMLPGDWK